jgi:fatty acid desaturase
MYVGVPCYNLKKLSREIAGDMPEPRTLREAWQEMRESWRRQQANPDYEFDTPLPSAAES